MDGWIDGRVDGWRIGPGVEVHIAIGGQIETYEREARLYEDSQIDLAKKVTTSHRLLQGSLPTAFLSHLLRTETSADGLDPGSCEGASTSSAHATHCGRCRPPA